MAVHEQVGVLPQHHTHITHALRQGNRAVRHYIRHRQCEIFGYVDFPSGGCGLKQGHFGAVATRHVQVVVELEEALHEELLDLDAGYLDVLEVLVEDEILLFHHHAQVWREQGHFEVLVLEAVGLVGFYVVD